MRRAKLMDVIGPENTYPNLAAGVAAFLLRHDERSTTEGQNEQLSAGEHATS
jgi:hypothetical protein